MQVAPKQVQMGPNGLSPWWRIPLECWQDSDSYFYSSLSLSLSFFSLSVYPWHSLALSASALNSYYLSAHEERGRAYLCVLCCGVMGEAAGANTLHHQNGATHEYDHNQSLELDIYPLSSYYFGAKNSIPFKDETLADRLSRMKSKFVFFFFFCFCFLQFYTCLFCSF